MTRLERLDTMYAVHQLMLSVQAEFVRAPTQEAGGRESILRTRLDESRVRCCPGLPSTYTTSPGDDLGLALAPWPVEFGDEIAVQGRPWPVEVVDLA